MSFGSFSWNIWEGVDIEVFSATLEAELADYFARESGTRPNDFTPTNPSVVNTVNVAIAPPIPTVDNLQPTIEYAQAIAAESVAEFGVQETPLVVTLLETLDDAGDLAGYLVRKVPAFWFGNIQIIMNGLTDAQRTIVGNFDIGSQVSVTKSFPGSTPSTVTQIMALEGISHDITPDRHIVTLYPNPTRIYTYFIVGGYTTTTTRTNLVTNPNFETNATGWTGGGTASASVARSTAQQFIGTASLAVTSGANGTQRAFCQNAAPRIAVTAGTSYTFSAYTKSPTAARLVDFVISWYNGSGTYLSDTESADFTNTTTGWTRITYTVTAIANSFSCTPSVRFFNTLTGEVNYIDAVLVEQASSVLPYFDGTYADTYTGYTLTSQGWNGTADASTSTATWGLDSSFVGSELNDDTKGLA